MSINPAKIQGVLAKASDQQLMQMLQRPDKIPSMFIQQEIARRKQMRQAQKAEQASLNLPPSEMAQQGTQVPRQQMQMQSPMKMSRGGQPYNRPMENFMTPQMMDELARRDRANKKEETSSNPLGLNLPTSDPALQQLVTRMGPINKVLEGGATVPLATNTQPAINLDVGASIEDMAPIEIPDMLQNYRRVLEKEAEKSNSGAFESSEIQNQLAKSIQTDEAKLNNINPLELISQKIAPQRLETRAATRPTNLSPAQIGAMRTNRQDQQLSDLTSAPASQTNSGVRSLLDAPPANNNFRDSMMDKVLLSKRQASPLLSNEGFEKIYPSTASELEKSKISVMAPNTPFISPISTIGERTQNLTDAVNKNVDKTIHSIKTFKPLVERIEEEKSRGQRPDNATLDSFTTKRNSTPSNATLDSFTSSPIQTAKNIDAKASAAKKANIIPSNYEKEAGITSQSKNNNIVTDNKDPVVESILDTITSIGNSDTPDAPEAKQFKLNDEKLQSLQQSLMDAMKPQASASQRFFQLVSEFGAKVASSDRPGFMAAAGQAMDETMKSMQGMRDEDRAMFIKRAQLGVEFELSRRQNEMDMMKFMAERGDANAIRELEKQGLLLDAAFSNRTYGLDLDKVNETKRSNISNEKILKARIDQDKIESGNAETRNRINSLSQGLSVLQEQAADGMTDPNKLPQIQNDITNIINELQRLGGITPSTAPVVDKIFE